MYAVEFKAKIKNGTIEVPKKYRSEISESVKVIILNDYKARRKTADSVDPIRDLLAAPLKISGFSALTRDECHERY